ncbi:hypothetical protein MPH_12693 [Macrophomina phaseolina MS6]|uniref:Uncharacterized protein n=1 Tax=Macrophomina phaseolina (strain MS6) TaxID=1126212 RepID=K2R7G2_MACPH|nr:hypothetical protein MPH_12693 [Macrophomina phaseolina MS6]
MARCPLRPRIIHSCGERAKDRWTRLGAYSAPSQGNKGRAGQHVQRVRSAISSHVPRSTRVNLGLLLQAVSLVLVTSSTARSRVLHLIARNSSQNLRKYVDHPHSRCPQHHKEGASLISPISSILQPLPPSHPPRNNANNGTNTNNHSHVCLPLPPHRPRRQSGRHRRLRRHPQCSLRPQARSYHRRRHLRHHLHRLWHQRHHAPRTRALLLRVGLPRRARQPRVARPRHDHLRSARHVHGRGDICRRALREQEGVRRDFDCSRRGCGRGWIGL